MTIQNIRYWDAPEITSTPISIDENIKSDSLAQDIVQDYSSSQYSFDSTLFDMLGQGSAYSNKLYTTSFFGYDLNSPDQLRDASKKAKEMGLEKVLAAQLASPLPFSSSNSTSRDKQNSYDGLNNIATLTMQLHMAKARKSFDHINQTTTMSLEEYINSVVDD